MLFPTHLLLGITFFMLFKDLFSAGNPLLLLLLVILASLLPDIDEAHSTINRWFTPGKMVAFFSRHRGSFHSLLFAAILSVVLSMLFIPAYGTAIFLGYISHLLGDALTPMGIPLFYPFSSWRLRGPFKTGGLGEVCLFLLLAVLDLRLLL